MGCEFFGGLIWGIVANWLGQPPLLCEGLCGLSQSIRLSCVELRSKRLSLGPASFGPWGSAAGPKTTLGRPTWVGAILRVEREPYSGSNGSDKRQT